MFSHLPNGVEGEADLTASAKLKADRQWAIVIFPSTVSRGTTPGCSAARCKITLGLTLGKARGAALVGFGPPSRAAAEKLGIAEETARVVLKRMFAKTGVSRESELTALLTRLILR